MSDRPLVSVVTPTWQRHDLLLEAIENVRQQTYRPLEHVIVSDGEDEDLREAIEAEEAVYLDRLDREMFVERTLPGIAYVPAYFFELGRNWSSYLKDSFCAAPNVVGSLLARGEYQMWLADDERMEPDHISSLVDLLDETGADFAYSKVRMYRLGQTPEQGWDIGVSSPSMGSITNVLYRTELLKRGLYPFGAGMISDWACISQWLKADATYAFLDRVTLSHRADH